MTARQSLGSNVSHRPGPGGAGTLQFGSRPARVLIVDHRDSLASLERRLEALGAQVQRLNRSRQIAIAADGQAPDLILLDMAPSEADAAIRALKNDPRTHALPIVALTAPDDLETRVQSLDEGAADCVARPFSLTELIARIRAVLRMKAREDLLKRRVSFLEELAASDPLTSLLNRRAFIDRLHLEMERAMRSGEPLSCVILDIDWFKSVNDRYGHQVGDDVLRQVAKLLVEGRREDDAVCRYGGEEFVWLLPGLDRDGLLDRAEWLRQTVADAEIPTAEGAFGITISVGAATYRLREHGRLSAHELLDQADSALLEAKRLGKNRVVFREPVESGTQPFGSDADDESAGDAAVQGSQESRHARPEDEHADTWDAAKEAKFQKELRSVLHSGVKIMLSALDTKDPETTMHCRRVSSIAVAVSQEMGLAPHEVERIQLASLLHDLGKLAIPESILHKTEPLTPADWELIKQHPERGAAMLQDAEPFSPLADLVLYHQESYDGTGYPDGLAGRDIPLGARIIRVADTFDAMLSDRPYRPRKTLEGAKAELRRMAGRALDPAVVDALLRLLETMPPVDMQLTVRGVRGPVSEPPLKPVQGEMRSSSAVQPTNDAPTYPTSSASEEPSRATRAPSSVSLLSNPS